ncbi:MAG: tetratricopeptide repeat protein [Bryobacteraceae bacterium]|nr:tetratricopeptide repeat protein [Bryobacteraceae bacterium]
MTWQIAPVLQELQVMLEAAVLYRDAGRYEQARDIFTGVRWLAPASPLPEIGLGTVEFAQGRFEQAKRHYQRALERDPACAWAYAQLGEAELFSLNREAARAALERARALDPAGEFGRLAESLLELEGQVTFEGER